MKTRNTILAELSLTPAARLYLGHALDNMPANPADATLEEEIYGVLWNHIVALEERRESDLEAFRAFARLHDTDDIGFLYGDALRELGEEPRDQWKTIDAFDTIVRAHKLHKA